MTKVKVLFVCLGNICRSPLAEGIFKEKVEEKGLSSHFEIDSCGTSNYHIGELPDPRTRANARQNGIQLNHRGRQFEAEDFVTFDYILPMDESNMANVNKLRPEDARAKVVKMRFYDEKSPDADVPDPYYGGDRGFQVVFDILERSTEKFLNELIEVHHLR